MVRGVGTVAKLIPAPFQLVMVNGGMDYKNPDTNEMLRVACYLYSKEPS